MPEFTEHFNLSQRPNARQLGLEHVWDLLEGSLLSRTRVTNRPHDAEGSLSYRPLRLNFHGWTATRGGREGRTGGLDGLCRVQKVQ